jgi:hypothetical protein
MDLPDSLFLCNRHQRSKVNWWSYEKERVERIVLTEASMNYRTSILVYEEKQKIKRIERWELNTRRRKMGRGLN